MNMEKEVQEWDMRKNEYCVVADGDVDQAEIQSSSSVEFQTTSVTQKMNDENAPPGNNDDLVENKNEKLEDALENSNWSSLSVSREFQSSLKRQCLNDENEGLVNKLDLVQNENKTFESTPEDPISHSKTESDLPHVVLGSKDSNIYNMTYKYKGKCYIFNHKNFESKTKLKPRCCTDADAVSLASMFGELGFRTRMFNDLNSKEITEILAKAGKENYEDYGCFVCCILTYGENGMLYAKDEKYSAKEIYAPFSADDCRSLAGKPKIVFIQASQGERRTTGGKPPINADGNDLSQTENQNFGIPAFSDFLTVYSTLPDIIHWRHADNTRRNYTHDGSLFIQTFCEILPEIRSRNIVHILTTVKNKVAKEFSDHSSEIHQVPRISSQLTKSLVFDA